MWICDSSPASNLAQFWMSSVNFCSNLKNLFSTDQRMSRNRVQQICGWGCLLLLWHMQHILSSVTFDMWYLPNTPDGQFELEKKPLNCPQIVILTNYDLIWDQIVNQFYIWTVPKFFFVWILPNFDSMWDEISNISSTLFPPAFPSSVHFAKLCLQSSCKGAK